MISIEFTRTCSQATHNTQANLAAEPGWVRSEKAVTAWREEVTLLDDAIAEESSWRTQCRDAAEQWQADVEEASLTLGGQANGVHRFKAVGSNSGSEEFAVVEATVAVVAAAWFCGAAFMPLQAPDIVAA